MFIILQYITEILPFHYIDKILGIYILILWVSMFDIKFNGEKFNIKLNKKN